MNNDKMIKNATLIVSEMAKALVISRELLKKRG